MLLGISTSTFIFLVQGKFSHAEKLQSTHKQQKQAKLFFKSLFTSMDPIDWIQYISLVPLIELVVHSMIWSTSTSFTCQKVRVTGFYSYEYDFLAVYSNNFATNLPLVMTFKVEALLHQVGHV
jgi:hypothetical protein